MGSSSEEAGQIKQSSSSEVTASDTTESSRPKDSSATESSQQQPGIRQDTLEEIDEENSAVNGAKQPTFQIQHATEQEVDDFYQVQPTATATEGDESTAADATADATETDKSADTSEVKLESKTPPPSPAIEQGSYDMEGADTSLVEAAAIASRELEVEETGNKNDQTGNAPAPSAATPSSGGQLEPALIHSDDDPSKEDDDKDDEILPTKDDIPRRKQHDADSDSSEE